MNGQGILNKQNAIDKLAKKCGFINKTNAGKIYDAFMDIVQEALCTNDGIRLHNVGTFKLIHCKEKQCHNPQKKGEKITIPARMKVKFSASKNLAESVNS